MAKKRIRRVKILLIIGVIVAALLFLRAKLRPYVVSLAEMEGKRLGSAAINSGVVAVFAEEKLTYSEVVNIAYAADGKVVSLHADAERLNALRLAVGDAVSEALAEAPPTSVRVSLGNLLGELFAGRGFAITVKLDSISTVDVVFSSEFASAGINQTLHRISMTVEVCFTILAATYRIETVSTCSFDLAETVIVGDVPEYYSDIGIVSEGG